MWLIYLYGKIVQIFSMVIFLHWRNRLRLGKEDPLRIQERWGKATLPCPQGSLVWIHGASVGESLVGLLLVRRIRKKYPSLSILITSGTRTSAQLIEKQRPEGVLHQYVPLDHPVWVRRFLDYWRPSVALWVESEIWPSFLSQLYRRHVPIILVNGRMGERSFQRWRRFSFLSADLFSYFSLCLCQDNQDAFRFSRLGITKTRVVGNLKFSMAPLPFDEGELTRLSGQIGTRRVWLAASTQPAEDEIVALIHQRLKRSFPDLLTLIAPRHPEKIDIGAIEKLGLTVKVRSRGEDITSNTDIYFADTIGEMGLMYRLSEIVFVGKSLKAHGGQNPVEAAYLNSAIIVGPFVKNFGVIVEEMIDCGAIIQILDVAGLEEKVRQMLWDPHSEQVKALKENAYRYVEQKAKALDVAMACLDPFFSSLEQNGDNVGNHPQH